MKRRQTAHTPQPDQVEQIRPLKPRPVLLAVLSIAFALWIAALLAMYFLTTKR